MFSRLSVRLVRTLAGLAFVAVIAAPMGSAAHVAAHDVDGGGLSAAGLMILVDATSHPGPGSGTALMIFPGGRRVKVTFNCVIVTMLGADHAMGAYGFGDDGRIYFIGLRKSAPTDKVHVSTVGSTGPCGAPWPDRDIAPGWVFS